MVNIMKRIKVPESGIIFGNQKVYSHGEIMKIYKAALRKYFKDPFLYADYINSLEDELIELGVHCYELDSICEKVKEQVKTK